jgi:hypothetical protein
VKFLKRKFSKRKLRTSARSKKGNFVYRNSRCNLNIAENFKPETEYQYERSKWDPKKDKDIQEKKNNTIKIEKNPSIAFQEEMLKY